MDKFDKAIEFLQEKQRSLKCAHMMKSMDGEATEKDIDEYREEFALYRLALTALKQQQEREPGCEHCRGWDSRCGANYCPLCGRDLRKVDAE